jgi:hypothetical protein
MNDFKEQYLQKEKEFYELKNIAIDRVNSILEIYRKYAINERIAREIDDKNYQINTMYSHHRYFPEISEDAKIGFNDTNINFIIEHYDDRMSEHYEYYYSFDLSTIFCFDFDALLRGLEITLKNKIKEEYQKQIKDLNIKKDLMQDKLNTLNVSIESLEKKILNAAEAEEDRPGPAKSL